MGYLHIDNLYKNQDILLFKECYALEKIHGTSAHIAYKDGQLTFFPGGTKYENFICLFYEQSDFDKADELDCDLEHWALREKLAGLDCVIYGEAYGGKEQGMSATYGSKLRFVAFDVKINDQWLSVPQADEFCQSIGLEFVDYEKIPTDMQSIDAQRDRYSTQAARRGMGCDKKREGIVLRPLVEMTKNNGSRVICKHKCDEFREVKTPRIVSEADLKVLADANEIANEWCTINRLNNILSKLTGKVSMERMPEIMQAMLVDIEREAAGEIIFSKEAKKAISKLTANLTKEYFQRKLNETHI